MLRRLHDRRLGATLGFVVTALAMLPGSAGAASDELSWPNIVGGEAISVRQAPWQVFLQTDVPVAGQPGETIRSACGGSILDSTHVVTAAHCIYSPTQRAAMAPSYITVVAGTSTLSGPSPGETPQSVGVTTVRPHPLYDPVNPGSPDDIATLTLAQPLDLNGASAAIALTAPGAAPAAGASVRLTGFGVQQRGTPMDGRLYSLVTSVIDPSVCGGSANALFICTTSPTGSACFGDSGGGLTTTAATPALAGVASFVTAPDVASQCGVGTVNGFTNLAAPEIRDFVLGNDAPPLAPRGGSGATISGQVVEGRPLTCVPGSWTNGPTFAYAFVDAATGQALQQGSSATYSPAKSDLGRSIACTVFATTAGGTATARTAAVGPVQSPPRIVVALEPAKPKVAPGKRLRLRIRLRARIADAHDVTVCAKAVKGGRVVAAPKAKKASARRACWSLSGLKVDRRHSFRLSVRAGKAARRLVVRANARATLAEPRSARVAVPVRRRGAR